MRVLLSQEISANSVNVSYNGGGGVLLFSKKQLHLVSLIRLVMARQTE
jgi:hypothetical protein